MLSLILAGAVGETPAKRRRARSRVEESPGSEFEKACSRLEAWAEEEETWAAQLDARLHATRTRRPIATVLRELVTPDAMRGGARAIWVLADFDDPEEMYVADALRELAADRVQVEAFLTCVASGSVGRFERALFAALLVEGSAASLEPLERASAPVLATLSAFAATNASRALVQRKKDELAAWRNAQELSCVAHDNGFAFTAPHRPEATVLAEGRCATLRLHFDIDGRLWPRELENVPTPTLLAGAAVEPAVRASCTFELFSDGAPPEFGSIQTVATLPARTRTWATDRAIVWDYASATFTHDPARRAAFLAWLSGTRP